MSEIRILSAPDFDALSHIATRAYPGFKIVTTEVCRRTKAEVSPISNSFGGNP